MEKKKSEIFESIMCLGKWLVVMYSMYVVKGLQNKFYGCLNKGKIKQAVTFMPVLIK